MTPHLTPREIEVVRRIAQAKTNKIIAQELGITVGTLKGYLHHLMKKLGMSNRTEVATWIVRTVGPLLFCWALCAQP